MAVFNQTIEFAYPAVVLQGELSNFRVSKNKWVYFDLKDETSSVKCFGTVYQLPGPLEDGMLLQIRAVPRLHNLFGFSLNIQAMMPFGEGSLKKAADLLRVKLTAEGLFDAKRKRLLPYPPRKIGLIASSESAAYHDFTKILAERWQGVDVLLADVQVQGEAAVGQVVRAIEHFNSHDLDVDVLVITRGGGSADDLAVFSTEQVTRAVAGSRIPTLVAIGHEVDISLAELAADQRASTPSNAAQLLTPDRRYELQQLSKLPNDMYQLTKQILRQGRRDLINSSEMLSKEVSSVLTQSRQRLDAQKSLLDAYDPNAALRRGYALVRDKSLHIIRSIDDLEVGSTFTVSLHDGSAEAKITKTTKGVY